MFKTIVKDDYTQVSKAAFEIMKEVLDSSDNIVIGLATGSSPVGLYKEMIADHKESGRSYKEVLTFNLDEYVGLPRDHKESYWTFMHDNLFNGLDIPDDNVHVPLGNGDIEKNCKDYEDALKKQNVTIQVLGIGSDGHIGFNEPGCPFDSETHEMVLTEQTRADNARFFDGDINQVPKTAVTMGLASIMRAKKIIMIATGENKAKAISDMINGPKSTDCPASILQDHKDVTVILDKDAARLL